MTVVAIKWAKSSIEGFVCWKGAKRGNANYRCTCEKGRKRGQAESGSVYYYGLRICST